MGKDRNKIRNNEEEMKIGENSLRKLIRNDNKNDGFNKNGDNNNKEEKNITPIRIKRRNYYKNDDTTKMKNEIKEKEKDNIKNNSYIKSKRENKILKNEDRDDINCDDIKVNKKNVSKNIDIKTKPDDIIVSIIPTITPLFKGNHSYAFVVDGYNIIPVPTPPNIIANKSIYKLFDKYIV